MKLDQSVYLDAIEAELEQLLAPCDPDTAPMYAMMRYHMGWLNSQLQPEPASRGKRLRPVMCLLACEAVGGDWRRALPAACAVELIHNFSLIHDDIEDNSDTRRHRTTVWKLWGLAQGINTGDAMWAVARLATSGLSKNAYSSETVLRAVHCLDGACLELCSGQYMDMHFETAKHVSLQSYERMVQGKTAALLGGALELGALLGGASDSTIEAYRAFGFELGIAFQIVDDILGIWGDPKVTGKSVASDLLEKKKTAPILYTLHSEADQGMSALSDLYARDTLGPADVPAALAALKSCDARTWSQAQARGHHEEMLRHLDQAGTDSRNPAHDALRALAESLLERSF